MKDNIRDFEVEDYDPELDRRLDIALAEKSREHSVIFFPEEGESK